MSLYNNDLLGPFNAQWPQAQPHDNRIYSLDWSRYLATASGSPSGVADTVSGSVWTFPTVSGAPFNPGAESGVMASGTATYVRVASGQPGVIYSFINTVTTTQGNVMSQIVDLPIAPA